MSHPAPRNSPDAIRPAPGATRRDAASAIAWSLGALLRASWVLLLTAAVAACGTETVCPTGTEGSPCLPFGDAGPRPEVPARPDATADTTTDPDVPVDGGGDTTPDDTEPLDIDDNHPDDAAGDTADAPADVQESAATPPARLTEDGHPTTIGTRGALALHHDARRRGAWTPPGRARPVPPLAA